MTGIRGWHVRLLRLRFVVLRRSDQCFFGLRIRRGCLECGRWTLRMVTPA